MSLPSLPLLTGDDHLDLQTVVAWIYDFIRAFPNAVGSAIDPSMGQGGDAALTITEVPIDIVYTPTSSLSVDGTLFGQIDVTFTKPDRAVDVIAYYKEHSAAVYKQSTLTVSPSQLISLKVGVQYDIQLAGRAANNSLGPLSPLITLTIPTSILATGVPINFTATGVYEGSFLTWNPPSGTIPFLYEVERAADALFTVNVFHYIVAGTTFLHSLTALPDIDRIGVIRYYRVRSIDKAGTTSAYTAGLSVTTLNVPDKSISYGKVQDVTVTARLLGRASSGAGSIEQIGLASGLAFSGGNLGFSVDTGWSTTGTASDKALASGDTLVATQNVLGTLIATLITKGLLSA